MPSSLQSSTQSSADENEHDKKDCNFINHSLIEPDENEHDMEHYNLSNY